VRLRGSCGQSLGAFAVQGLRLEVWGDSNDYVGKGFVGWGDRHPAHDSANYCWSENTIIGNTVLYGATSGKLFARARPVSGFVCAIRAP